MASQVNLSATGQWGTVLAVQANYYRVQLEHDLLLTGDATQAILLCTRRARLKKLGQTVRVGDRVWVEEPDWQGGRGAIASVHTRHTNLQRPPVANASQVLLMFALAEPDLDPYQLTRFLITVATTDLSVVLCLNKQDLVAPQVRTQWQARLQGWGYDPILMSLHQGNGLERLRARLSGELTVVSGPSGVGKSSLINRLIPELEVRVGEVSDHWGKGKHTTRHVELFNLPEGGLLADSPGFNQPQIVCPPPALAQHFPEARQRLANHACRFKDCLHRDEPGCVVRGDWERYPTYLTLLDETEAHQMALQQRARPEAQVKRKSKGQGDTQYEPRLAKKRYRRPSRRTEQQQLRHLYPDKTRTHP